MSRHEPKPMPADVKAELAELRRKKRAETNAARHAESKATLQASTQRARARLDQLRTQHFKNKYGARWREALAARAAGAPLPEGIDS